LAQLEDILIRHRIAGVILADMQLDPDDRQSLCQTCRAHDCWVRSLKLGFEEIPLLEV
jgi:hypothetical protein